MSEQTRCGARRRPTRHGLRDLAGRLYRGEAGIDVVGKRKIWYVGRRRHRAGADPRASWSGRSTSASSSRAATRSPCRRASARWRRSRGAVEEAGAEVVLGPGGRRRATPTYLIKTAELDADPRSRPTKAAEIKTELAERFNIPADADQRERGQRRLGRARSPSRR